MSLLLELELVRVLELLVLVDDRKSVEDCELSPAKADEEVLMLVDVLVLLVLESLVSVSVSVSVSDVPVDNSALVVMVLSVL
ncbi:hypothetical protein MVES1_000123 [Malassezia vespertilionis]|uniref:uncharacterized protein n=1 Tax=Malassezia vespertilionis TaxID=2020962 RepID=UPI0024B04398|nr:uncharacterized protein MVES1_000123 [Malassezia vespertilionis]WFD04799.1 hypothetical protein MVES1_000123 [Malassezia vespertilionis]